MKFNDITFDHTCPAFFFFHLSTLPRFYCTLMFFIEKVVRYNSFEIHQTSYGKDNLSEICKQHCTKCLVAHIHSYLFEF